MTDLFVLKHSLLLCDRYVALNPQAQVPTLEVRDLATGQTVVLTQSLPIIEFLDEAFPQVGVRDLVILLLIVLNCGLMKMMVVVVRVGAARCIAAASLAATGLSSCGSAGGIV